jgi:hypothetical protein
MGGAKAKTIVPGQVGFVRGGEGDKGQQLQDHHSVRLRMVPMELDNGGVAEAVEPKGRLLRSSDSGGRLWLLEEEIPREGTQVDRVYRCARWQDGRTSMWTARRRRVGRGEVERFALRRARSWPKLFNQQIGPAGKVAVCPFTHKSDTTDRRG